MKPEYRPFVDELIELCIKEDIGDGDHTSLSCIPAGEHGRMRLLCKQEVIGSIPFASTNSGCRSFAKTSQVLYNAELFQMTRFIRSHKFFKNLEK